MYTTLLNISIIYFIFKIIDLITFNRSYKIRVKTLFVTLNIVEMFFIHLNRFFII